MAEAPHERRPRMPIQRDGEPPQRRSFWRTVGMRFWVLVVVLLVLNYLSVAIFAPGREASVRLPYQPDFIEQVENDNVVKISTTGESVSGELRSEEHTSELQSRLHLVC